MTRTLEKIQTTPPGAVGIAAGRSLTMAAIGLAMIVLSHVCALAGPAPEYQVKAAFLYNFAKFATFPPQALPADTATFTIAVLGDDPFGTTLDQTVQGKTIADRKIVVRRIDSADEAKHCQLLFVCASHKKEYASILSRLKGQNILTVGESEGFATKGGMINFYVEDNRVRFEINPKAADRAGIQISSQLLRLGRTVADEPASNGS
ncbi:MAG TPA: YfiR family protein [Capsulimonadaceae bacterium]